MAGSGFIRSGRCKEPEGKAVVQGRFPLGIIIHFSRFDDPSTGAVAEWPFSPLCTDHMPA